MKNLLSILFYLTLSVQAAWGQAALGVSSSGLLYFKDSVQLGSQLNVELYVVNVGDENYTGPLAVNFELGNVSFIMKGREMVTDFAPSDSHKIKFSIPFTDQTVGIGSHIVVVWPTGSNIRTIDTITRAVKVFNSLSVQSIWESVFDRVSVFPNPATHFVKIKPGSNEPLPVSIILLDGHGHIFESSLNSSSCLDVSNLSPGLYYLRILFADGQVASYKLVINRKN
jgi:hypothetical protein